MIGLHVDIAALLAWRPEIPVMRESTAKSGEGRHHRRERYQAKRGRQSERRKSLSPRDHEILLKLSPTSIDQLSRLGLIYISVDGASGRPNDYSVALTCLAKGCFGAVAQCKHVCRWDDGQPRPPLLQLVSLDGRAHRYHRKQSDGSDRTAAVGR